MIEISNKELSIIRGGVSGAILSSIIKGANIILEIGRCLGSSIRRYLTRNFC